MKKILSAIAIIGLLAGSAFATDAEYTWREGVRSTVVSNILGVSVTSAGDFAITSNLTVTGSAAAASLATTAGITDTDATSNSVISAIGFEASDATIVLDADQGDDAADTWTIESEAADNDLSFVNGTTEALKITSGGAVTATDDFTCDKIIFTDAVAAAATNDASYGFLVTVNGTNFYLNLFPAND